MPPATGPNPIDLHVGRRVRLRRREAGMTQDALAARLGLTFQQVQKYERGANRISASKLYEIAAALGVPVAEFFEGLPPTEGDEGRKTRGAVQRALDRLVDTREGAALAGLFPRIASARLRRDVVGLVRAVVAEA